MVDYSVVVPVYFNEGSLEYTANKVRAEVFEKRPNLKGEIIFVDDGSDDGSYAELRRIKAAHSEDVRVIKLSRNFGQDNAIWCGMQHAEGAVIIISADGQDPIELMPTMLDRHFGSDVEVVIATRESREETWWRRITSAIVYKLIKTLGHADMPAGGFDFMLLGKRAKSALLKRWQANTFLQIRVLETGFRREFIPYHRADRISGVSRWTFAKKFTVTIDALLGHSYIPIRIITLLGLAFSSLSFLMALYFFVSYFWDDHVARGLTPVILLVLFIGGLMMMMIGVIGEYLWRVLAQTRESEPYIIEEEMDAEPS